MLLTETEYGSAASESRDSFDREAMACRQPLRRYAVRLTGCPVDAEDLVQETMLRALRAWRTFTPGTRIGPWLRTILYHLFANQYQARRRMSGRLDLDYPVLADHSSEKVMVDPFRVLGRRFLNERLTGAIQQLSPEHRETVQLSDVEGFSDQEVAELLGVALGTVKSRLFRARRRLRESLSATAADMGYGRAATLSGASMLEPPGISGRSVPVRSDVHNEVPHRRRAS